MAKDINTLIPDIESVMQNEHKCDPENLDNMLEEIRNVVKEYVENPVTERKFELRLSKIGTEPRRAWYEAHRVSDTPKPLDYQTVMRFFLGSLLEAVMIFLAKEAGHSVTKEQKEIELEGVPGHMDLELDGHICDIKTASGFSFRSKFKQGKLLKGDDPYGYIAQLSAYDRVEGNTGKPAYFWALNKENGEMVLLPLSTFEMIDPVEKINTLKEVIEMDEPPAEKCYEPKPMGTSGNKVLDFGCVYCPFKWECWKGANNGEGLKAYRYSTKDEFFVTIGKEPTVPEVTHEYAQAKEQE